MSGQYNGDVSKQRFIKSLMKNLKKSIVAMYGLYQDVDEFNTYDDAYLENTSVWCNYYTTSLDYNFYKKFREDLEKAIKKIEAKKDTDFDRILKKLKEFYNHNEAFPLKIKIDSISHLQDEMYFQIDIRFRDDIKVSELYVLPIHVNNSDDLTENIKINVRSSSSYTVLIDFIGKNVEKINCDQSLSKFKDKNNNIVENDIRKILNHFLENKSSGLLFNVKLKKGKIKNDVIENVKSAMYLYDMMESGKDEQDILFELKCMGQENLIKIIEKNV